MKISIIHIMINGLIGVILAINGVLFNNVLFWIVIIPTSIISAFCIDELINIEKKIYDYLSNNKNIDKSEIMNEWDKLNK